MHRKELKLPWLFLGSLITNTGISFIWPLTTIYMHEYLHESLTVSGLVLLINSLATMGGNYVGGRLFDRWKPYPTILGGITINIVATLSLIFFHGWPAYPLLLILLGLGNGVVATGVNAYATLVTSRKPSYVFNVLYFMSNLGLVIGTLIVGFVLPFGITYIFILACALFVLFWIVAFLHFKVQKPQRAKNASVKATRQPIAKHVLWLMVLLFVTWVAYEQWQSNVSAFMLSLGMNVRDYSLVWTLNAVEIVLFQPVLTVFDEWLSKHIRARLTTGFALFAVSFVILLVARQYWQFLGAMAVLTIGEILALPAVSTYVDLFSPNDARGRYQGFVQMLASAGRAVGPVMGALLIDATNYHVLFISVIVMLVAMNTIFSTQASRALSPRNP
ncbi:MDR family MFS transporter [Lacticaseibacillus manihotivorans]|jgi:MFS family permease|uniref:MFS superfamily transporter n=2 Tax=Lacticaseibacillus manihotivorans TaxID=88233 RepID=A0A0R1R215_9LACO|nr:MFS transporter [Lacticaseibacillus manihotivorans]KRL47304.1 MFS superfamily transporter [Lacticaseibacillus manihotivorans DSM 13343 = JCM 12514]QFQ90552.1 MFS transporter [Lacticaseibacillus manihotivorans]